MGGYIIGADHDFSIGSGARIALIKTHSDGSCLSLGTDFSTAPNATSATPAAGSVLASLSNLTSVDANIQNISKYIAIVELAP